jgi:hypothetical protein
LKRAFAVAACLLIFLTMAACKRDVRLQRVPPLIAGDAGIRVVLTYDRNNTLELRLSNVQPPESFGAQYTRYVVWTETAGAPPVNVGQIRVEGGKGKMQTLTPLRRFGVLITVEEKGDARQPGPLAVFHTSKEVEW